MKKYKNILKSQERIKEEEKNGNLYFKWNMKFSKFTELTLSRIWQHTKKGFVILSAFRETRSEEKNLSYHKRLQKELSFLKFGFIEVDGCYVYDEDKNIIGEELSLFVPYSNKVYNTLEHFKKVMIDLGRKYNQDSILFVDESKIGWYLYPDGRIPKKLGKLTLDTIGKAFTRLRKGSHKGRTFIFEGLRIPSRFMEAIEMQTDGIMWTFTEMEKYSNN